VPKFTSFDLRDPEELATVLLRNEVVDASNALQVLATVVGVLVDRFLRNTQLTGKLLDLSPRNPL
jgi:hypothetical protein